MNKIFTIREHENKQEPDLRFHIFEAYPSTTDKNKCSSVKKPLCDHHDVEKLNTTSIKACLSVEQVEENIRMSFLCKKCIISFNKLISSLK